MKSSEGIIITALEFILCLGACGVKNPPPEEPDPDAFFGALEAGVYYVKFSPLASDYHEELVTEIAVDGENVESLYHIGDGYAIHTLLLGDKEYTLVDDSKSFYLRDWDEDGRTSRFYSLSISWLLAYQPHPCGSGTDKMELGGSPDDTEYYYEDYYATVGELRGVGWIFSDKTSDDVKMFLCLYFSGSGPYAFRYSAEGGMSAAYRIYEFSGEIPDKFTFEIPADYELRQG